jgi:hypothetical protein
LFLVRRRSLGEGGLSAVALAKVEKKSETPPRERRSRAY